jgi:hypothetical protein
MSGLSACCNISRRCQFTRPAVGGVWRQAPARPSPHYSIRSENRSPFSQPVYREVQHRLLPLIPPHDRHRAAPLLVGHLPGLPQLVGPLRLVSAIMPRQDKSPTTQPDDQQDGAESR